ncbi:MAG TPA: DUF2306 domain-containing protein [Longimicrobium sp.]|nr:DUF2306 domain-containing protein [Longimicrobium sp.]
MNVLGWFHTTCALAALGSGAVVLLRRKGTRVHRRTGWVYVCSMLALNGSALMIYRLFGGFGPFHVAAVLSLATVVAGTVPAVRRRPANWVEHHYAWMTWSYVGLCAAAVSEVATRTPGFRFWWAVFAGTFVVIGVGATLIRRNAASAVAPFQRRAPSAAPAAE